jgi:DNA repair protein RadD
LALGFVVDVEWKRLDMGRPKSKREKEDEEDELRVRLPKKCPACSALVPAKVYECYTCGWKAKKENTRTHVDGELIELQAVREKRLRGKANKDMSWPEKERFYSDLMAFGKTKGYSSGWAAHKYKTRFGVWPNDPRVKYARESSELSPDSRSWLKAQMIAYAKSKRREA